MKIRFYIFCIVCTCLTYSPASGKWAKFSDYSNGVGCKGYCTQDSDCNDGQCHVCDTKSHICKKGSKYDGKDYDTYEKCKCVSRKREWATTENKCCPKGEYNSDGHCCKKDNNDDTKTEIWCETAQKCQSKKESCCSDAKDGTDVNGTMTEACCKAANGSWSNATCCSTAKDGKDIQGTFTEACCKAANGTWEDNKCSFNQCPDGYVWDTSDEAKNYTGSTYKHVSGQGACCPESYWKNGVCCYRSRGSSYISPWTNGVTEACCTQRTNGILCPNGTCNTGCCFDALNGLESTYTGCYTCNTSTHKLEPATSSDNKYCPGEGGCSQGCCSFRQYGCYYFDNTAECCAGISAKETCSTPPGELYTYECQGNHTILAHTHYKDDGTVARGEYSFSDGSTDIPAVPTGADPKYFKQSLVDMLFIWVLVVDVSLV